MRHLDNLDDLKAWLASGKRGNTVIYWRGSLWVDRMALVWVPKMGVSSVFRPNQPAFTIQRSMWDAYEEGTVLLVQKKHGPADYEYRAIHL